jgi:glycosyltransferase involved in cell wall biosynthesis
LGNVVLEAQAARLPLIASDIPAHREAVAPVNHSRLFPLENLAVAKQLMLQPMSTEALQAGYNHVQTNYSIDKLVNDTVVLYKRLIQSPKHV